MWSTRRLSITTTTTFIGFAGAAVVIAAGSSSLLQELAPSSARPATPAPPARIRSRRVKSLAT